MIFSGDDQLAKRRKRGSGSLGEKPLDKQYNPFEQPNGDLAKKFPSDPPQSIGSSFSDSQSSSPLDAGMIQQTGSNVKHESFSPQISCEDATSNYFSDDTDVSSVFTTSPPIVKLEKDEDDFLRPLAEDIAANICTLEREYNEIFDIGYSEEQAKRFTEKPHNANELFNMTDIFIRRLIKFAKHIPEFRQLKQEDQIFLLKVGILSIYAWVKVFRIIPEFWILWLTFSGKSASKSWIRQIIMASLI